MIFADRVQETTTSTGTGNLTLAGAKTGFQSFSGAGLSGAGIPYVVVGQEGGGAEGEWEVGIGTISSGVLTRDTVLSSSNAGSAVNFSAGTKDVWNGTQASHMNTLRRLHLPPGGADDLEFEEDTTSIPSGYSWVNQGSALYGQKDGVACMLDESTSGGLRMLVRSFPAGFGTVEIQLDLLTPDGNGEAGLVFRESSSGELVFFIYKPTDWMSVVRFTDPSTGVAQPAVDQLIDNTTSVIMRATRNADNDWDFQWGIGGGVFTDMLLGYDPTANLTPDQVGFCVNNLDTGGDPTFAKFSYVRFS